ncbi:MAG: OmpA family protein [Candidatus Azobacteroides sp.]|nr:OmpA family protein [Candidatus Azobacteroides sp.]
MYFGEDDNKAKIKDRITPSFQLSAGKWVTHFVGARFQIGGYKMKGWNDGIGGLYMSKTHADPVSIDPQWSNPDRKWATPRNNIPTNPSDPAYDTHSGQLYEQEIRYFDMHVDFMFNLTSAIMGYSPTRVFNFIPYLGFGWVHSIGNDYLVRDDAFIPVAGAMFNFRLSDALDLGLDVKGTVVPEAFDSHIGGEDGTSYWTQEGYLSAVLSLTYKFKQREFERVYDMDVREIERLNRKITELMAQTPPKPNCPECPPAMAVTTTKTRVYLAPVHFPLDVHLVQRTEMYKVELAAKYLQEDPARTLHLEGYADRKTGNPTYNQGISERRVKEVRRILIEKYGIDPNRLTIGWQGDLKQPFEVNELNRAVLFVGEQEDVSENNYDRAPRPRPQARHNAPEGDIIIYSPGEAASPSQVSSSFTPDYPNASLPVIEEEVSSDYIAPNAQDVYQFSE